MIQINNAKKLKKDIETKISKWNERSNFSLKGIKNLSRADLDTLDLYANYIINYGSYIMAPSPLMQPLGDIEKVLEKYQCLEKSFF